MYENIIHTDRRNQWKLQRKISSSYFYTFKRNSIFLQDKSNRLNWGTDRKESWFIWWKHHHQGSRRQYPQKKIYESIINPFTIILLVIAMISMVTNVWLAKPGQEDPTTSIIIVVLVLISGGIRFVQELRSDKAATNLSKNDCEYSHGYSRRPEFRGRDWDLVVGDIVKLSAGDMIPADLLLIESRDFFVQQSWLDRWKWFSWKLALSKMVSQIW